MCPRKLKSSNSVTHSTFGFHWTLQNEFLPPSSTLLKQAPSPQGQGFKPPCGERLKTCAPAEGKLVRGDHERHDWPAEVKQRPSRFLSFQIKTQKQKETTFWQKKKRERKKTSLAISVQSLKARRRRVTLNADADDADVSSTDAAFLTQHWRKLATANRSPGSFTI